MTMILLIGQDDALVEGLAQLLAGAGYVPRIARSLDDATEQAARVLPLAAVVDRELAIEEPALLRIPLAAHGAVLLYRADGSSAAPLPAALARFVLADLSLPLERHRLLALVQRLAERARATGRAPQQPPPEQRA